MTNSVTNPHFTQTLHHETTGGVPGASPRWNGNVSADVWTTPDRPGAEAMVRTVKSASQEETGRYELYSDGTFTHNGILQETEYNRDGLLHIGNDRLTDMEKVNNNFHGSYLGDDNPISKEDNNGLTVDSYAVPPIDNLDYAAFQHDKAYDRVGAKGSDGAFKDKRTYLADYKLAYGALKNLSDAPGWGIGAFILFNPIAGSKFWRSLLGL